MWLILRNFVQRLFISSRVYHGSIYLTNMYNKRDYFKRGELILINGTTQAGKTELLEALVHSFRTLNPHRFLMRCLGFKRNVLVYAPENDHMEWFSDETIQATSFDLLTTLRYINFDNIQTLLIDDLDEYRGQTIKKLGILKDIAREYNCVVIVTNAITNVPIVPPNWPANEYEGRIKITGGDTVKRFPDRLLYIATSLVSGNPSEPLNVITAVLRGSNYLRERDDWKAVLIPRDDETNNILAPKNIISP